MKKHTQKKVNVAETIQKAVMRKELVIVKVKHFGGLSSSISLRITSRSLDVYFSVANCDQNWHWLRNINAIRTSCFGSVKVIVEEQRGFWDTDIVNVSFEKSVPYLYRFVSAAESRKRTDELMKSRKAATIAAGFQW